MMVDITQIFSIFPLKILISVLQWFSTILLSSFSNKVILAYVQDFEAILALSATGTYGPMFILSYATSVLYNTYFPEAVNLMRQCLFCNFLTPTFGEWETSLT